MKRDLQLSLEYELTVVLKESFLGWCSNYEGHLKRSWTGGNAPLLCRGRHSSITVALCSQSTNFSNGPRTTIPVGNLFWGAKKLLKTTEITVVLWAEI
jgi:hypothetical protein